MNDVLQTRKIDQLPPLVAATGDEQLAVQIPGGPMMRSNPAQLLGSAVALEAQLAANSGSEKVGFLSPWVDAVATTLKETNSRVVHVMDFVTALDRVKILAGQKPDLAYAYNKATRHTEAWSEALEYTIMAPPFRHKVRSTVYVRLGQTIDFQGAHIDCSDNDDVYRFRLGERLNGGVPQADPVGPPVMVRNGRSTGGSGSKGFFRTSAAGFAILNWFGTAPGLFIEMVNAADGLISNIEVDQSLLALAFTGSQNIKVCNFKCFVPNFAVQFGSDCRDITFSSFGIAYANNAAIYFADGASNIRGISFAAGALLLNGQNPSFAGFIYSRASNVEASFAAVTMRNGRGHFINQEAGSNCHFHLSGCVLDGAPGVVVDPLKAYTASTSAKGAYVGLNSSVELEGCQIRNLLGEIAAIPHPTSVFRMKGGSVANCPDTRLNITTGGQPRISIRGVSGFATVKNTATHRAIVLPYWGNSTAWEVKARANDGAGTGNGNYTSMEAGIVSVVYNFDGTTIKRFCDYSQKFKNPSRAIPGDLGLVACFGTAPGGPVESAAVEPAYGTICIAAPVPAADAFDFEWHAETLI